VPIVELSSPSLPGPLLRNKKKECVDRAQKQALLGRPQFRAIYEHVFKFIHGNMFVPCWREMKQVATLCEGKGVLSVDEKEGLLQLDLRNGKYRQQVKLRVPPDYPESGVRTEWLFSTFPQDIQYMHRSQTEEIVRRCEAGFAPEDAIHGTKILNQNKTAALAASASSSSSSSSISSKSTKPKPSQNAPQATKVTAEGLKSMKHDVAVLKQMADLRVATAKTDKRLYVTDANLEKKEARKDLRRLARSVAESDKEQQQQLMAEEEKEMKELMGRKMSDSAQPSVFVAAKYIVNNYVFRLPAEPCQACKKPILPAEPAAAGTSSSGLTSSEREPHRPVRTFCGHWLHWDCLDKWLTEPPFIRQCPVCDRRIWHPDWPEDHKQLEKAWQVKEARLREQQDVFDCF
jgi:hypothetical protein